MMFLRTLQKVKSLAKKNKLKQKHRKTYVLTEDKTQKVCIWKSTKSTDWKENQETTSRKRNHVHQQRAGKRKHSAIITISTLNLKTTLEYSFTFILRPRRRYKNS